MPNRLKMRSLILTLTPFRRRFCHLLTLFPINRYSSCNSNGIENGLSFFKKMPSKTFQEKMVLKMKFRIKSNLLNLFRVHQTFSFACCRFLSFAVRHLCFSVLSLSFTKPPELKVLPSSSFHRAHEY